MLNSKVKRNKKVGLLKLLADHFYFVLEANGPHDKPNLLFQGRVLVMAAAMPARAVSRRAGIVSRQRSGKRGCIAQTCGEHQHQRGHHAEDQKSV